MKNIFVFAAFGLFAVSLSASNSVSAPTLNEVLSQLKLKEESIQTLQFGFEQQVTFLNTNLTSQAEGQAFFEKPGKLNVHQKKPQEQFTITNGQKTWIYTPAYKQVWVGGGKKNFTELLPKGLIPFQNLGEDLEKNYKVTIVPNLSGAAHTVRLLAVPKNSSDVHLEFLISMESWLPEETVYITDSAKVLTKVKAVEINPTVPPSTFQFVPPAGTDIIPF